MTQQELIAKVQSYTRDFDGSIFRSLDITDWINEAIYRVRRIPELKSMPTLTHTEDSVTFLPEQYHYLLAVYATSRCFSQDENEYKAGTFMNEFESKLEELFSDIAKGDVTIIDPGTGVAVVVTNDIDYVTDTYFTYELEDLDSGVEGVE